MADDNGTVLGFGCLALDREDGLAGCMDWDARRGRIIVMWQVSVKDSG